MAGLKQDIPALNKFVAKVQHVVETTKEGADDFWPQLGDAMRELVSEDNWLPDSVAVPHPEYYQQYCLYLDPQERFSVVSFVWGPSQETPIHDHTVWGVIGQLRGAENGQGYRLDGDNPPVAYGEIDRLEQGDVAFVSPTVGDVHRVTNALDDQVSISIHVYGANIGKVHRHVYPEDGGPAKSFISGYSEPVLA